MDLKNLVVSAELIGRYTSREAAEKAWGVLFRAGAAFNVSYRRAAEERDRQGAVRLPIWKFRDLPAGPPPVYEDGGAWVGRLEFFMWLARPEGADGLLGRGQKLALHLERAMKKAGAEEGSAIFTPWIVSEPGEVLTFGELEWADHPPETAEDWGGVE